MITHYVYIYTHIYTYAQIGVLVCNKANWGSSVFFLYIYIITHIYIYVYIYMYIYICIYIHLIILFWILPTCQVMSSHIQFFWMLLVALATVFFIQV
jgi:hypothetical protein